LSTPLRRPTSVTHNLVTHNLVTYDVATYDVVIIGSCIAALRAALMGVRQKLRIALVLEQSADQPLMAMWQWQQQSLFEQLQSPPTAPIRMPEDVSELLTYTRQLAEQRSEQHSPAALAKAGIDVVIEEGVGQFCHHPQVGLRFEIGNRQLRSKAYLLAGLPSSASILPQVTQSLTTLHNGGNGSSPWLIYGDSPSACEMAYLLQRLGGQVSLALPTPTLLPCEDRWVQTQVVAQLEAWGGQIRQANDPSFLELANHQNINQILDYRFPLLDPNRWNLAKSGVEVTPAGIPVNAYLQTSHPQIYACGSLLAGYDRWELAQAEAFWVIQHRCSNRRPIDYQAIPWSIQLNPLLTRIGWSHLQASQRGATVQVYHYDLDAGACRDGDNHMGDVCQLLTDASGQVMGATMIGRQSQVLGPCLAIAIQKHLKLRDLTGILRM
jgi:pyruvate/2-oxoglutarate dehydrogenase complex dihydrolipoamide dehydrogenase (E3) component